MEKRENKLISVEITEKGSLGILALGDVGLRAWRRVKQEKIRKKNNEKE